MSCILSVASMAETKVVTAVDRAQGAQGDAKEVQRDIVHENADS